MSLLVSLWLPILLSAVAVFLVSSVIHMFLGYHASDYVGIPEEDRVMDALRSSGAQPGEYMVPHGEGMEAMSDPAFVEKYTKGPAAMITIMEPGPPTMGKQLVQWFVYMVAAAVMVAYIATLALEPGAPYMDVFRLVSAAAFATLGVALWQSSIWYGKKWSTTLKNTFDALIYALVMAGVFGWLWPAG